METCFIVNPNARSGRGLKIWNRVRSFLSKYGMEYELYFTADTGDAAAIAHKLTQELPEKEEKCVFVIGDDETLNEVLNGLHHLPRIHLGFLSAAPEEGCSRGLRLSRNPKQLLKASGSGNGRLEAMDYGVLTCENGEMTRRFAGVSGIGFDAALCQRIERLRKESSGMLRSGGKLRELSEYFAELVRSRPCKGYLVLDGSRRIEFNNLMFVSAHIHPYEGNHKLAKYADPKDGMLEICAVSCKKKLKLLPVFFHSRFRSLNSSSVVRMYQCQEAHIHFERPCAVHTDGACIGTQTDIELRCVRQQLKMYR